jgi:hypothetical protein
MASLVFDLQHAHRAGLSGRDKMRAAARLTIERANLDDPDQTVRCRRRRNAA